MDGAVVLPAALRELDRHRLLAGEGVARDLLVELAARLLLDVERVDVTLVRDHELVRACRERLDLLALRVLEADREAWTDRAVQRRRRRGRRGDGHRSACGPEGHDGGDDCDAY